MFIFGIPALVTFLATAATSASTTALIAGGVGAIVGRALSSARQNGMQARSDDSGRPTNAEIDAAIQELEGMRHR